MIWDGARESWEASPPRPWLAARRMADYAITAVFGLAIAALIIAVAP